MTGHARRLKSCGQPEKTADLVIGKNRCFFRLTVEAAAFFYPLVF